LANLWTTFSHDGVDACASLGETLRTRLGLDIVDMTAQQSRFFKHHYKANFKNTGPMSRE
jgi:hypothetical protein